MIFQWFEKRRRDRKAKLTLQKSWLLLARLGELIEENPVAYMDETWLPCDKAAMKSALKIAMVAATDKKQMDWLETGWVMLANFQKGVGDTPISCELPETPTPEVGKILDRYLAMSAKAEKEVKRNLQELRGFKKSLSSTAGMSN